LQAFQWQALDIHSFIQAIEVSCGNDVDRSFSRLESAAGVILWILIFSRVAFE